MPKKEKSQNRFIKVPFNLLEKAGNIKRNTYNKSIVSDVLFYLLIKSIKTNGLFLSGEQYSLINKRTGLSRSAISSRLNSLVSVGFADKLIDSKTNKLYGFRLISINRVCDILGIENRKRKSKRSKFLRNGFHHGDGEHAVTTYVNYKRKRYHKPIPLLYIEVVDGDTKDSLRKKILQAQLIYTAKIRLNRICDRRRRKIQVDPTIIAIGCRKIASNLGFTNQNSGLKFRNLLSDSSFLKIHEVKEIVVDNIALSDMKDFLSKQKKGFFHFKKTTSYLGTIYKHGCYLIEILNKDVFSHRWKNFPFEGTYKKVDQLKEQMLLYSQQKEIAKLIS